MRAVRVAIVLRVRENLIHGEGPQHVGVYEAIYLNVNAEVHPLDVREKQKRLSLMVVTDGSIRFNDLYGLLHNPDWLLSAYKNVRQNAGSKTAGCDGVTMRDFDMEMEANLLSLREQLKAETFEPLPVRRSYISEQKYGGRMKRRPLGIPSIKDRIVQEALRMILEPIFEVDFSRNSYGFRPNRCTKDAVAYLGLRLTRPPGYGWVIEGDIHSFFDMIDHQKLMRLLGRRIKDKRLLTLIWKLLRAGVMEQGNLRVSTLGTPQGGIISPLLANIYLHELDRYMERYTDLSENKKRQRKGKGLGNFLYVRYADDFVVLCDGSKENAETMKQELNEFLSTELRLTLSMEKTKITHIDKGFRFLGFWIERAVGMSGKRAPRIRIPEESVKEFRDKMRKTFSPKTSNDSFTSKIIAANGIIRGWCQYYQHTSSPGYHFGKLTDEIYWLAAHWLGRKQKLSMPGIMRQYLRGISFGTGAHTLLMPQEFKAKRYQAKTLHNPYLSSDTALTRENWDRLIDEWGGEEQRKGSLDLKEWIYQRDKGRCGLCGEPVKKRESEMDHKTPWFRFKHTNAANQEDNLWILCRTCHLGKTKSDLQSGSRVR
jgi:group II intron reverse transcriptase/maturase